MITVAIMLVFFHDLAIAATDSLLTKNDVGALRLPDHIARVEAPFKTQKFVMPVFPSLTVSIADRGAVQEKSATKIIQATIDEVSKKGGGKVIIPPGVWLTGRIILKNDVNLVISKNAELRFSGEIADYLPVVFTRSAGIEGMSLGACIYANGQKHIGITGKGKLVGPATGSLKKQAIGYGTFEKIVPVEKPAEERILDGRNNGYVFLPNFIGPVNCKDVFIEGISLEHTAFWNIVPIYCDGVIIRGVTVNSVGIPSGDGIDIESCKNVLIEYCTLSCGDDCFTIKSGRGIDGLSVNKPTENIIVRYCLAKEGLGGITTGSETAGMIRNLYVHDCVFDGTNVGIRLKTRRPRGGGGENLYYKRIRMNLRSSAFGVDMLGASIDVGKLASRESTQKDRFTPLYRNVIVDNILVENAQQFVKIDGLPESPFKNLVLKNAVVNCTKLIRINDAVGILIKNVEVTSKDSLIQILNGSNITFDHINFKVPGNQIITNILGSGSKDIEFKDCQPSKPVNWALPIWKDK